MEYAELPEFSHELKRLQKKYRSLDDDVEKLKPTLAARLTQEASKNWTCLHRGEQMCIYKTRLACRYLRATTMRVIYAHHTDLNRIIFIELYYKGDKENEDQPRIQAYLKEQDKIQE